MTADLQLAAVVGGRGKSGSGRGGGSGGGRGGGGFGGGGGIGVVVVVIVDGGGGSGVGGGGGESANGGSSGGGGSNCSNGSGLAYPENWLEITRGQREHWEQRNKQRSYVHWNSELRGILFDSGYRQLSHQAASGV